MLDGNPLEDIHATKDVRYTMIGGVLYDADSMDRLWPTPQKRKPFHFQMRQTN